MKEKRKDRKHKKKKSKKEKKSKRRQSTSSASGSSDSDQWVEQSNFKDTKSNDENKNFDSSRDDWMSMTGMIATYTKDDIKTDRKVKDKDKKHIDSYNPATSVRELNPYWKDGGSGLPTTSGKIRASKPFKRPYNDGDFYGQKHDKDLYKKPERDDRHSKKSQDSSHFNRPENRDDFYRKSERYSGFKKPSSDSDDFYERSGRNIRKIDDNSSSRCKESQSSNSSTNWKKSSENRSPKLQADTKHSPIDEIIDTKEIKPNNSDESEKYLSDEKMNKLAAKIVKAEIMGDDQLVNRLKLKLEDARNYRKDNPDAGKVMDQPEDILLLSTSSRGDSRPLTKSCNAGDPRSKGGKRKAETHTDRERMKYFSNDHAHSLSQMFEQEKYGSNYDNDAQLANVVAKHTNPNDDLEDIFTEEISKNVNQAKEDEKNKQRAIKEHVKLEKSLEGCEFCVGSKVMMKHLMVSCGKKVYLALPARKSLTNGHCVITTVQHATCVTALDEDVWEEILNFRKALVSFFNSRDEDVVFFETAVKLHKYPHLVIDCVPMPRDVGDTAPIYFKKALLECEAEWSMNKKVVDLKGKNIRRGIPKGLPYFWVDFGMDPGFAHVIEDQQLFPNNFAEEIIGGILDLDHRLWKKPQREQSDQLRRKVSEFVLAWRPFDTVSQSKI